MVFSNEELKKKLENYLLQDLKKSQEIFDQLSLYVYQHEAKEVDLYILAKLLPHEYLVKLISFFNGDIIKVPTKEQFKNCYLIAICFYLKETKQLTWLQIRNKLNLSEEEFNTYGIGRRIENIKKDLSKDLLLALNKLKEKEENINE